MHPRHKTGHAKSVAAPTAAIALAALDSAALITLSGLLALLGLWR